METDHALIETIRSIEALTTARARIASARQHVEEVAVPALRAARDAEDGTLRDLVAVLYWGAPELPVRTIASFVGSDEEVRRLAGPGPALPPCGTCGEARRARTRTELRSPAGGCASCEGERRRQEEERQRRLEEERRRQAEERAEREDLSAWDEHVRRWHADEAEDETERERLLGVWAQLPRWSCGCPDTRYASSRHYW